jgi:23S rRNA (cytidine1920-2'-O)/16S rRNA (cytidine1409-2'-O)-methyltransferase
LEKALHEFNIDVKGRVCLDVGASTGGFTDCLLQACAQFVYAVDVGYGQIAWSLRTDARVKVIERTNARFLTPNILRTGDDFYKAPSLAVVDVSFISLIKILPAIKECLANDSSEILALVKPQFEAGPENVGKGGVVRSSSVHSKVI